MEKSNDQIENVDSDQMVPVFTLMCPGISLSILSHDIRLLNILKFKDICNRVAVTIEYDPIKTDVYVTNNKLHQKTKVCIYNGGRKDAKYDVRCNGLTRDGQILNGLTRANENVYSREQPYSPGHFGMTYHPSLESKTDLVGETDMISSFLEAQKITDVTWVKKEDNADYREDMSVIPTTCQESTIHQCVPAHQHKPWYIFTRYPRPKTGLDM